MPLFILSDRLWYLYKQCVYMLPVEIVQQVGKYLQYIYLRFYAGIIDCIILGAVN